jgi:hypothetical protein
MKLKGLESFLDENTTKLDRFLDWRPIENDLHQIMIDTHVKMYSTKRGRVGSMKTLGPSVIDKNHSQHFWQMGRNTFEFGTKVFYSHMYDAKMKDHHKKRSHVQMPAKTRRAVNERIALWFTEGK